MFLNFSKIFSTCLWVIVGFFAAQVGLAYATGLFVELGLLRASDLDKPLPQLLFLAAAYSLALVTVVILPRLFDKQNNLPAELGIEKKPKITYIGLSIIGYGAYLALTVTVSSLIHNLWRGFNPNQEQMVGFNNLSGGFEHAMAFMALVIIAPIVEEMLFRGYLFGRLRARTGFWASTLITSALFGLVHLQWNVGVDVFALSLVLCYLREKTGAVWTGIALHMIKNAVAFTFLFLHPDLLKNLL